MVTHLFQKGGKKEEDGQTLGQPEKKENFRQEGGLGRASSKVFCKDKTDDQLSSRRGGSLGAKSGRLGRKHVYRNWERNRVN